MRLYLSPIPGESVPNIGQIPSKLRQYSGATADLWDWAAGCMADRGTLDRASRFQLSGLCDAHERVERLRAVVEKSGTEQHVLIRSTGQTIIREHPAAAALRGAERSYMAWLRACGLTPTSANKIQPATQFL